MKSHYCNRIILLTTDEEIKLEKERVQRTMKRGKKLYYLMGNKSSLFAFYSEMECNFKFSMSIIKFFIFVSISQHFCQNYELTALVPFSDNGMSYVKLRLCGRVFFFIIVPRSGEMSMAMSQVCSVTEKKYVALRYCVYRD